MAYCAPVDLLLGGIPLPTYIDPVKQINDAADEIDSKLGFQYVTPFDVTDAGPLARPVRLLLKRINAHLATGRLILAVASPEENRNLHAYGWQLIQESLVALNSINIGDIALDGATLNPNGATIGATVPLISNLDKSSRVEDFYTGITYPYRYPIDAEQFPPYHYPDALAP